jgi:hypothetical protein
VPAASRPATLRPWMGCLLSLLLAALCLCPTLMLLRLGLRGDIVLNGGQMGDVRLWMTRSEQGAALALSTTRPIESSLGAGCQRTRVVFLPIGLPDKPEGATYCSCPGSAGAAVQPGRCPP